MPNNAKKRRFARPAALVAALALPLAALSGCAAEPRAFVGLDEAFAAARPELARELRRLPLRRPPFPRSLGSAPIPLDRGPSVLYEKAAAFFAAGPEAAPRVLVASPLLAAALLSAREGRGTEPPAGAAGQSGRDGEARAGRGAGASGGKGGGGAEGAPRPLYDGAILVPEWRGAPLPGLAAASTDPLPAYRAAGRAMGAFVAALRASGNDGAAGALLFSPSTERPEAARRAFSEAFESAAGFPPLVVRIPAGGALGGASGGGASGDGASGGGRAVEGPAGDGSLEAPDATAALEKILAYDCRILLVAVGSRSAAAAVEAERQGLAIGVDAPAAHPEAAFRIAPDDRGLARALASLARRGAFPAEGSLLFVPARLLAGDSASGYRAGSGNLALFLKEAVAAEAKPADTE